MDWPCRGAWTLILLASVAVLPCGRLQAVAQAVAQPPAVGQLNSSRKMLLHRADSATLAELERVNAHLEARQWDEAVETLRRVLDGAEEKLMPVTDRRWISLRAYCHLQVAGLPSEALALYRAQVDPVAERWYRDGMATRDRKLLGRVVERAFASSWGDDALMALGEMSLEEGDFAAARWYWERIVPVQIATDTAWTWPGYPDTELDLAAVRARLVLVSILEGSTERAADELKQFVRLHGDAMGRLGGRDVELAQALGELLAESRLAPPLESNGDWPMFAGSPTRNRTATAVADVGRVLWRMPLSERLDSISELPSEQDLGCYPVCVNGLVLVHNGLEIKAVDSQTGQSPWGAATSTIYRGQTGNAGIITTDVEAALKAGQTMTVFDGRLYARLGSSLVSPSSAEMTMFSAVGNLGGFLVCLDLGAEGRLVWKATAEEGWTFEGSPVVDDSGVYVGMRCGAMPESHVACFDARTGRLRWRVFVCGSESTGRDPVSEYAQNLLALRHGMLYYNTNMGAVACISAENGRIQWVSLYPRQQVAMELPQPRVSERYLNPCLIDHDMLLVAPADSSRIFAIDAATGQILWQTGTHLEDVRHLLGTTSEHLIAAGDRLYWIALRGEDRGQVKHVWPDGGDAPGYGRGILAGNEVIWPTRERIYVFDQATAQPKKVFELVPRGAGGGNLIVADGRLYIATSNELIALGVEGGPNDTRAASVVEEGASGDR